MHASSLILRTAATYTHSKPVYSNRNSVTYPSLILCFRFLPIHSFALFGNFPQSSLSKKDQTNNLVYSSSHAVWVIIWIRIDLALYSRTVRKFSAMQPHLSSMNQTPFQLELVLIYLYKFYSREIIYRWTESWCTNLYMVWIDYNAVYR